MVTLSDAEARNASDEMVRLVALNLKKLRNARGWTQGELVRASKVGRATISEIESRKRNPRIGTLAQVAAAFGVSIAVLFATISDG